MGQSIKAGEQLRAKGDAAREGRFPDPEITVFKHQKIPPGTLLTAYALIPYFSLTTNLVAP